MISCAEAVRQLWEYLDQTLPEQDHEAIESHLLFCRRCCGELEFARELHRFLAAHQARELPETVQGRLEAFLRDLASGGASVENDEQASEP